MTGAALAALAACLLGLALAHDWRPALLLLCGAALPLAGFVWAEAAPETGRLAPGSATTLVAIDLVAALTVGLILLVTGLSYSHEYNREDLDELGLFELRRAARRALRLSTPGGSGAYLLPVLGFALVGVATLLLPRLYPFAPRAVHYAWTLALLTGVLLVVTAGTLLKGGLGLLLLVWGIKLLYLTTTPRVGLIEIALLHLVSIGLALMVAYLSSLLYARLRTLDLETMFGEAERQA